MEVVIVNWMMIGIVVVLVVVGIIFVVVFVVFIYKIKCNKSNFGIFVFYIKEKF